MPQRSYTDGSLIEGAGDASGEQNRSRKRFACISKAASYLNASQRVGLGFTLNLVQHDANHNIKISRIVDFSRFENREFAVTGAPAYNADADLLDACSAWSLWPSHVMPSVAGEGRLT